MIDVYLNLNGNAEEASRFYAQALQGEVTFKMKFSDMPEGEKDQIPAGADDLLMYANIKTRAGDVMLSDNMPGFTSTPTDSVWISLSFSDHAYLTHCFDALAKDGEVIMPLEPTFWSPLYGQVRDKYGFYWMFMDPTYAEG